MRLTEIENFNSCPQSWSSMAKHVIRLPFYDHDYKEIRSFAIPKNSVLSKLLVALLMSSGKENADDPANGFLNI